jgi:hypothetical protein
MVSLSKFLIHKNALIKNKVQIMEATQMLFKERAEAFNGRNTSRNYFEQRVKIFDTLFSEYVK